MNKLFKTLVILLLTSSCIVSESPIPQNGNILCYNKMQPIAIPIYKFEWNREKQNTALHCTAILIGSDNDSIAFTLLTAKHCIENKERICFGCLYPKNPQIPNIVCYPVKPGYNYFRLGNDSIDAAIFIIYKEARFVLPEWVEVTIVHKIISIHQDSVLGKNIFYYNYPIGGDIVTFGYPMGYGAKTTGLNKPVLITGNIAFDEISKFAEGPVLLGDYYSLGGLSGGPVFLITKEIKGKEIIYGYNFIGLNIAHYDDIVLYSVDSASFNSNKKDTLMIVTNTGLSQIVSTKILRELLYKAGVWERENE